MHLSRKYLSRCAVALALLCLPFGVMAQILTISAASSLTDAFKELAPRFEAAHAGATVRLNFAASGVLLQQLSQGAPVDVFASADQNTMDRAAAQKLINPATRRDFATNTVVLIEPVLGAVGIKTLQDLSGPSVKRIAIGKPGTVPVGRYTQQALESAHVWTELTPRIVPADNVRQVLDYVARGEVEAGFVYRTDAALMPNKVRIVFTATGHDPVRYPVAVAADSAQKTLAQEFTIFLTTAAAEEILARYGFGKP